MQDEEDVMGTPLGDEIDRLRALNAELLAALVHIEEYWNRRDNDTAMYDALWHMIETAQAAIKHAKEVQS